MYQLMKLLPSDNNLINELSISFDTTEDLIILYIYTIYKKKKVSNMFSRKTTQFCMVLSRVKYDEGKSSKTKTTDWGLI